MSSVQPQLGTLEYVFEVAKDWTRAQFAAAQTADFVLAPYRSSCSAQPSGGGRPLHTKGNLRLTPYGRRGTQPPGHTAPI
jgi:hypothetical protein